MRTSYIGRLVAVLTLVLYVACLSGCGGTISALSNSSTSSRSAKLSSSSLKFGNVASGTSSSAQSVTVSNTGETGINISAITLSEIDANTFNFNQSNNCPTILAAGNSCTITASFTPVTAGSFAAAVTITDNAVPSAQTIILTGIAPPVAVTLSTAATALNRGQTAQLITTVTNTANKSVTWLISPIGVGSINISGLYTAPAIVTTAQIVTVTATSLADTTASSSTTIVLEPSVAVSVSPASTALNKGQTAQLTATVTNTANKSVTWIISPVGVGSISISGLYTAPAIVTTAQIVTVTATSLADTTASSSTTITLQHLVTVSVSPESSTVYANGTNQLTATVTNALDSSVGWGAVLGRITSEGLYTAPSNTGSSALTDTITATSIEDPTKSATATVTVSSGLVGWWPLNEGTGLVAYDISGQGNNGAWTGPPTPPNWTYYTTGEIGSAAGHFGSGNSLTIGTQPVYQFTGPFTLSAWVNTVSDGMILTKQNDATNGYNLGIYHGVIRFCVFADTTENCVGDAYSMSSNPTWIYVTGVFDGLKIFVYANGILVQSHNVVAPTASTGRLVFGITQRGGYSNFTGSLDDIRIFRRALSAIEISSLYNVDVGTPNAPTILQTFPGNSQVGLSWLAPTTGQTLTNYFVNYRKSGTSLWTAFSHPNSTATFTTVMGLTNGTSYDFEVIGVNNAGAGLPSGLLTATPTTTPQPPTVRVTSNVTCALSGSDVTLTATVTNALNPSVTWSALLGRITSEGLYTAPSNTGSSTFTDTVTATSIEDSTVFATATITISSGLVGWWPLNEGTGMVAYDISGQGNNGTWSGPSSPPSWTYYTTGEIGSAAGHFDSGDSLTIGTQPVYQFTGPFTLSIWVNTVSDGMILTKQNDAINGYNLGIYHGVIRFCIFVDAAENCVDGGNSTLSSTTWSYLTGAFDGSKFSVYANGVLVQSRNVVAPTASTGSLVFGIPQRGGYSNFTGSLDDIRIFSRALSPSEISSLYNVVVGTPNAPTKLQAFPGNSQVELSWDTPTTGAVTTDYTVVFRQSGTSTWRVFFRNHSVVNSQVVIGLTNGTSYDFEVIPVSAIGSGIESNIVSSTPTSRDWSVVASDDDEFIGPFSSWLNVKTDFGAVGDGASDDTYAFQSALNALESASSHASVLYIPAGTYKITSGLNYVSSNCNTYCMGNSIIGENPTNTILKWQGNGTGSAMFTLDGINRMQFNRLTLDGNGAQITLIDETMYKGCCYDGSNEYTDDIFENASIGIKAGNNIVGCCSAETKVDRDTFANLTEAGISLQSWNAVDWYIRYSTFEHNHYGVTNAYGAGGAMHLDHNLFEYNGIDCGWGNASSQSYTYNTSYYSGVFLAGSPFGNSGGILIGNTILVPRIAAILSPGMGPLTLINNIIEGTITAAQSSDQRVTFADGSTSTPNSYVTSMGNKYISATPFSVQNATYSTNVITGGLTSINDTVVSISVIHATLPVMPGPLPNYHRAIYDVPHGASASTIKATIDQAIAENNGNRPVVHIPWGEYSVASTITIPGNSDVQIVGDSIQTIINWNGSTSSPVFALLPPGHAEIRNLTINAASSSAGILVEGYDKPGDRIYTNFVSEGSPGSLHNLLVNGFDNTLVQMDDFAHGGASGTSVLIVGGPLSKAGNATPGYTGLFMGSSCCSANSYRVEDGGTLVLTGFWYEQGGPGWLDLDGASGNFIGYQDQIGLASGGRLPSYTANNFTGNLTILNSGIGNGRISLTGSTPANVLLLADSFNPTVSALVQPPVITNTNTNPNTQAATVYSTWLSTVPDYVFAGTSRNTLIQNSLIQLASYKDPALTDLPSANEDVRLIDVIVNNGVNSFDFESVTSNFSPRTHFSAAGNKVIFGFAPRSRPTSPWCKSISKGGTAAGSIASRRNSGPGELLSLDWANNCSGVR